MNDYSRPLVRSIDAVIRTLPPHGVAARRD